MTIERKDFAAFFAALHGGRSPFAWQERLLDELLETGSWPSRIVAPTGAGKTAAIDVHVFAVALTSGIDRPRLPRRLAMVVGRRVLVDDQYQHAELLRKALARQTSDEIRGVAARLGSLRWPRGHRATEDDADESPLVVARLRGGAAPSREWRDYPTACAVICGTPDMWGSRLLFRGYGTARLARPREAGLLALDAAVVVDEAHLSRQLLTTAEQVARLATAAVEPVPVPALQVVETTATPARDEAAGGREVAVEDDDLTVDEVLRDRLCKPKPVTEVTTPEWPAATAPQRRRVASRLADEVVALLGEPVAGELPLHTVGCYVNTVAMAVEVAGILRSRLAPDGTPMRVVMVCGQTRPADLEILGGVLTVDGDATVDVLVTTQSLEVGVDLDLSAIVTELAPGSALVQRSGRVNRRGLRTSGPIRIVIPESALADKARSGPYSRDELALACEWVSRRAADPAGMAPWAIRKDAPPVAAQRRMLFQRPQLADAWHLARTSDDLAAEPQLDLWLDESFDEQSTAGLVVRDSMPVDASDARELIRLLPPREREVFTVPVKMVRKLTAQAVSESASAAGQDESNPPLVVRVRGDDVAVMGPQADEVRPGDVVVMDSRLAAFTPSTSSGTEGFSPPVPLPPDAEPVEGVPGVPAADVLHTGKPHVGRVALRLEPSAWPTAAWVASLLKEYADIPEETKESDRRATLKRLLTTYADGQDLGPRAHTVKAAIDLLGSRRVRDSELRLDLDPAGGPMRLVLIDRRHVWADERLRQTWQPRRQVALDTHQAAVADRAALVANEVGLPPPLVDALHSAGRYHDEGKADRRFQAGFRGTEQMPLAKSDVPWDESRRLAREAGLPQRWRHEQRSVVASWAALHAGLPPAYAQLAARLVGTSHGHGRSGFPHAAATLLAGGDSGADWKLAQELFDTGSWDDLIETTERHWGVWGCAYLEALLRAADGQASAEGT